MLCMVTEVLNQNLTWGLWKLTSVLSLDNLPNRSENSRPTVLYMQLIQTRQLCEDNGIQKFNYSHVDVVRALF